MPNNRISPAEQMRQSLEQFFSGGMTSEEEPTSTSVRLAARVVLQEALEAEQREVVGRDRSHISANLTMALFVTPGEFHRSTAARDKMPGAVDEKKDGILS